MRTIEQNEKLIAVLAKWSLTADEPVTGDVIVIRDSKNTIIGSVTLCGTIERKKIGQRVLMGALIRNDLAAALA